MPASDSVYIDIIANSAKSIAGLAKLGAAIFAVNKVYQGLKKISSDLLGEYIQGEQAAAKLATTLRATGGAAGLTFRELTAMANEMQRTTTFSDDMVQGAQAVMLTFTKIGKEVFPDAIKAAADMSVLFGGDMQQATVQLGKALQDPVEGLTALKRIGVSFSEDQKAQIKGFVQANDIMSAQKIILNELSREFGGVAEAMGETTGGAFEKLKNAFSDVKEELGKGLAGILTPLAKQLTAFVNENKGRIAALVTNFPEIARTAFSGALEVLRIFFKPSNLWDTVKGLAIALVKTLEVAWNNLPKIAWDRIKLLATPFQYIAEAFVKVFDWAWAKIRNAGVGVLNKLFKTNIGEVEVPNLLEGLDSAYDKFVLNATSRTKTLVDDVAKALKEELVVMQTLGAALGETEAGQKVQEIIDRIRELTTALPEATGKWEEFSTGGTRAAEEVGSAMIKLNEHFDDYAGYTTDILGSLGTVWSNYYASQMEGMDKNSEEYKKLAQDQAKAERNWGIFMALVNTAVAVTKALASAPPPANIILAALATAAGMAQVAAISSAPIPAMAEGGIVTGPTNALIGEAGPEAVIPLNRAGGMLGNRVVVHVYGSVMEEEGLARRIGAIVGKQRRGY